jgi:hypothetical protein
MNVDYYHNTRNKSEGHLGCKKILNKVRLLNRGISWALSTGMWYPVVLKKFTDVSNECTTITFRVED